MTTGRESLLEARYPAQFVEWLRSFWLPRERLKVHVWMLDADDD